MESRTSARQNFGRFLIRVQLRKGEVGLLILGVFAFSYFCITWGVLISLNSLLPQFRFV